ncbi:MAG TPA: 23S rRNA (guanosine(2251)-2'-O)-methyltransferase RlmB [Mycoplasmatales bacterium]|jgi:23S rRNA (guanosine2251-2'-O)-methyltransferase|nr:23S rRNA (guanosine(2251)-2'-O)-methyltransferase RlmB [Mycoplasmatales bacterium]
MNLIAFGKNTLVNLLNSKLLSFKKIIISSEKEKNYKGILSVIKKKNIVYEILNKLEFNRFIPDKKHQGIIAFLNNFNYLTLEELIERFINEKNIFFVMLDSIEDPHNFGAIIRTCAALSIHGIIILDKNQVQINSTVLKVSTGGISHIPICRVSSLEKSIKALKLKNFTIFSAVCQYGEKSNNNEMYSSKKCVIFGNEHDGIKKKLVKISDQLVSIPLYNEMNSLNVSVSCGIVIHNLKNYQVLIEKNLDDDLKFSSDF